MSAPTSIEDLIAWFRRTIHTTAYGEVAIAVYMREGQVATTRRVVNETVRPPEDETRLTTKDRGV